MFSADSHHTVALNIDGTVKATELTGDNLFASGQCNVSDWDDIVAVSAGDNHTVGLKVDGTVVSTKYIGDKEYDFGQCNVSDWRDIVAVSAGYRHTVGLKADGTVVSTKYIGDEFHNYGQCNISDWKLFDDFDNIEEERLYSRKIKREKDEIRERERNTYRIQGKCQYCGGELKGLFCKKCINCGKPKDY